MTTTRLNFLRNLAVLPICTLICGCSSSYLKDYIVDSTPAAPSSPSASAERSPRAAIDGAANRAPDVTGGVTAPRAPVARACDRSKAVSVGMTTAEVYASCWGRPRNVNTSTLGSTKIETLFYDGYNYIYLENGVVKSIETSGR